MDADLKENSQMPPTGFEFSMLSDRGLRREQNEDSTLALPEGCVFAVADGLGGAAGGEIASRKLVDALAEAFKASPSSLTDQIRTAKRVVDDVNVGIKDLADKMGVRGMGTTAVILVFDLLNPASAAILHAGDSRAYRWCGGHLTQLTRDHSLVQALGAATMKLLPARYRGIVTRAIGVRESVELEVTPVTVEQQDILLLCSDGLSGMLSNQTLSRLIGEYASENLDALSQALIAAANEAGGDDNISVVLVRLGAAV
jgi:serine/threonine protein phosphatase PrpC